MKTKWLVAVLAISMGAALAAGARAEGLTKCHLTFSLQGWSVFYSSSSGSGEITCANGQSAHVSIRAKGGGLTVGKKDITNGKGDFSDVAGIEQVFGKYASAEADAGAGKSAQAQVVTKGPVSLALSGTGEGVNLGVSFGEFVIERAKGGKKK